ncbi:hypothetical protein LIER_00708 [Lithospermum erythrorhizon]|uniref:UBX domain-containing protein n=1 Tax=Lithospermum erythrorhizon TaxID=34254 RepID=A0AAV3NN52_LITER
MVLDSQLAFKRRRLNPINPMELQSAKMRLAAAQEKFGQEIRVFETSIASPTAGNFANSEEPDDFYDFTPEDYYRLLATKKEDKHLKTRKLREAEEAARRSKITKAVMRVRFPDNYTLEAKFHPSETIHSLIDLLKRVVAHPELPFYIYTTPPKKQIRDMSQDFYSAGFVPGAIVYFSYDFPKGSDTTAISGTFLKEEVMSLQGLEVVDEQIEPVESAMDTDEPSPAVAVPAIREQKPTAKKNIKPRWMKL